MLNKAIPKQLIEKYGKKIPVSRANGLETKLKRLQELKKEILDVEGDIYKTCTHAAGDIEYYLLNNYDVSGVFYTTHSIQCTVCHKFLAQIWEYGDGEFVLC